MHRLTSAEIWLLNYARLRQSPLWFAVPDLLDYVPYTPHTFSLQEICSSFYSLYQQGSINISDDAGADVLQLTQQDIEDLILSRDRHYSYGLTAQGGMLWEEEYKPDWTEFFSLDYRPDESLKKNGFKSTGDGVFMSPSLDIAKTFLKAQPYIFPLHYISVSETWKEIRPWQVTSWKTFPVAHQVIFRYKRARQSQLDAKQYDRWNKWWDELRYKWYVDP